MGKDTAAVRRSAEQLQRGTARGDRSPLTHWREVQRYPIGWGVIGGRKIDRGWWGGVRLTDSNLGTRYLDKKQQHCIHVQKLLQVLLFVSSTFCVFVFSFFVNAHQRTHIDDSDRCPAARVSSDSYTIFARRAQHFRPLTDSR